MPVTMTYCTPTRGSRTKVNRKRTIIMLSAKGHKFARTDLVVKTNFRSQPVWYW